MNGAAGGCSRRGEGRGMAVRAESKREEHQGAGEADESAREGSDRPRVMSRGAAAGVSGRWRDRRRGRPDSARDWPTLSQRERVGEAPAATSTSAARDNGVKWGGC